MKLLKRLFREEEGVTMIEYGLIAALIAIVVVAMLGFVGDQLLAVFTRVRDELQGAL